MTKLNQLLNDATLGLWMMLVGLGVIIGKKLLDGLNKVIDFIWKAMFEKGAKAIGEVVSNRVSIELEPMKERAQRIEGRVRRIEHKLKNDDAAKSGAFDLILEDLEEIKQSIKPKRKK